MRVTSITDCVLVAVEPSVRMPEMMLDEGTLTENTAE
jgi:hypothetical protein